MRSFTEYISTGGWTKVYIAVVVTTIVVITLLWAFSRYFRP
jgi:hypothetical protein